jgi:hypothetical protein
MIYKVSIKYKYESPTEWTYKDYSDADIQYCELCRKSTTSQQFQTGVAEIDFIEVKGLYETQLKKMIIHSYNKNEI